MWYFYIARCQDNSLYCGVSNNTFNRIIRHNQSHGANWFKKHGEGTVVYQESFETFKEARTREAQIKRWSRMKKENLINGEHPSTHPASQDSLGVKSSKKILWKQKISAGGIVYKKESDQLFILLIKTSGATVEKKQVWTFPKGHIDEGEKPEEAALREVREEAGVNATIKEKLGSVKYTFVWEGENILKIVTWYLMEYVSGDPSDHDHEVTEAKWIDLDEVEKMISYKTDKEIFNKAKKLLGPPQT